MCVNRRHNIDEERQNKMNQIVKFDEAAWFHLIETDFCSSMLSKQCDTDKNQIFYDKFWFISFARRTTVYALRNFMQEYVQPATLVPNKKLMLDCLGEHDEQVWLFVNFNPIGDWSDGDVWSQFVRAFPEDKYTLEQIEE